MKNSSTAIQNKIYKIILNKTMFCIDNGGKAIRQHRVCETVAFWRLAEYRGSILTTESS